MNGHLVRFALLFALVGLRVRGRHHRAWFFVVYALAVILLGALARIDPVRFNLPPWAYRYDLFSLLKLAVAVEVGSSVLSAFPRVLAQAKVGALVLLDLGLFFIAFGGPIDNADWRVRVPTVDLVLFAYLGLIVVWFNLPLDRWHQHLLIGFTVQLGLAGALGSVLSMAGYGWAALVDTLRQRADVLIALWWMVGAWMPEKSPEWVRAPALGRA